MLLVRSMLPNQLMWILQVSKSLELCELLPLLHIVSVHELLQLPTQGLSLSIKFRVPRSALSKRSSHPRESAHSGMLGVGPAAGLDS